MVILYILGSLILLYLLLTLLFTYLVQQFPRKAMEDKPDWGTVTDTTIQAIDGRVLEVWKIEPDMPSRGIVLLAHGWGRNRDRMVYRARFFGQWGYTTVIHSARDHGNSSPRRFMNAFRFAEDIEAVIKWINQPLILYGHSAGAGAAAIAANRNPDSIKLLFLEACYSDTREALLSLYRWFNRFFGICFGPMILFWMNLFYRNQLRAFSPANLAPAIQMPVLLIHGEKDSRFPVEFAHQLKASFPPHQVELFVAAGVGHSDSSLTAEWPERVRSFLERRAAFD